MLFVYVLYSYGHSEMNASLQFGDAFDLPFDEMGVSVNDNDAMYNADGSFALGEIMQQTSVSHFADVTEPSPAQSALHSLTHEIEAAPVERSFLESLYDSLRNSFQRQQNDNDASVGQHDALQTSVSEQTVAPQAAAKVARISAMLHGKTKLYVHPTAGRALISRANHSGQTGSILY
jgi:hypothetical protein